MPSPYEVQRCFSCGFEYLSPRPTRDELIELYLAHPFFEPDKLATRPRRRGFDRARLERLERWTGGPGSLLVVSATEGGWIMDNARRGGWNVLGIDFIPSLLDAAAARDIKMVDSPLWDLDVLTGEKFDAIQTISLEHVPDLLGVLSQFRDLLRPNGVLLIEAPNQFEGLKERVKLGALALLGERVLPHFHSESAPYFHLWYFTPRTLREALIHTGFEVVESRSYLSWNPIYQQRRRLRTLREVSFLLGGLIDRGPSVEVIARPAASRNAIAGSRE